jgi:hypothetical protein
VISNLKKKEPVRRELRRKKKGEGTSPERKNKVGGRRGTGD